MRIIKKEYKEVVKTVKENTTTYDSIVCDKCGKEKVREFDSPYIEDYYDDLWKNEFQSFGCSFGYGSKHDNERWSFDLCEDCLVEIISTFKHVPSGFFNDNYANLNSEQHQKAFEKFKETGSWDISEFVDYSDWYDDSEDETEEDA